jgi:hypothetical protein
MDDRLHVQQDMENLESLDAKKLRYIGNREGFLEECDGGDDVMEMGEMM